MSLSSDRVLSQFGRKLLWYWGLVWWSSYLFFVWVLFQVENCPNIISPPQKNPTSNIGLGSDIDVLFSFKLGMVIDITKLYSLIPVWMTLTFIQGRSWLRKQNLVCSFSRKFFIRLGWNLDCCHLLLLCSPARSLGFTVLGEIFAYVTVF